MKWKLPLFWTVSILLAGCNPIASDTEGESIKEQGQTAETETGKEQEQTVETGVANESTAPDTTSEPNEMSNEDIIKETGEQINTGIPVLLPKALPIQNKHYLTSVTNSQQNQYTIKFYETEQPMPINSEKLKNTESNLATIKATEYSSADEAAKQISYMDHSANGAQAVDLGQGIKGYMDAGAGSQFLGWNEGRWSLAMRAHTDQGDEIVNEAKKAVQLLEEQTLPIPHEYGAIELDVSNTSSRTQHIAWQDGKVIYEIATPGSFLDALNIAASMNK